MIVVKNWCEQEVRTVPRGASDVISCDALRAEARSHGLALQITR